MTHVTKVEFTNWARYAGRVAVELGPEIYAVEAQWEGDDKRSNWGGKSMFVESFPFALYGWHRFAGKGAGAEDAWITKGESEGGVRITLSTGHVLDRSRVRGKATKLVLEHEGRKALGDAAQAEIDKLLGLSRDDFFSTCFFRQKQLARFVTGDPGERQKLVADWCQLAPLQRAAKRASTALNEALRKRERVEGNVAAFEQVERRYLPATFGEHEVTGRNELVNVVGKLKDEVGAALGRLSNLRAQREAYVTWHAQAMAFSNSSQALHQAAEADEEAKRLRAAVPALPSLEPLYAEHQAATSNARTKSRLASGKFDGQCPVGGCPCPIKDDLNAAHERNAAALREAEGKLKDATQALEKGQREESAARVADREATRAEAKAKALKEQAQKLQEQRPHTAPPAQVDAREVDQADVALVHVRGALARAEDALKNLLQVERDIAGAREESARLAVEVEELRASCAALGRQGAQRLVAAGAVGTIEEAANAGLGAAGVGLVVRMRWDREGAELAAECDVCGTPIKGQTAKSCPKCGAPREKARVERLDVELSDRSGAAEDLAGLALQLGAAGWLRRKRESSWATCVLDEPFGALDESLRDSVAAYLIAMLRGRGGFSQGFVIAHHRGVLDAMPGHIIVRAGAKGSTLEVMR